MWMTPRPLAASFARLAVLWMLPLPLAALSQTTTLPAAEPAAQASVATGPTGPTGPTRAALAAPTTTGLKADPAQVLAGTPTSGAITMMPGETYYGPGPITVGYLGAKKQLVLPNGAWVFVAVADRPSLHTSAVPLVSMVFAQFREGRLISLMSYLFSSRPVRSPGWADADECHNGKAPASGLKEALVQGPGRACGWTVHQTRMPQVADPAWEQAPAVVQRLGAAMPPPPLQFTRAWATDHNGSYVAVRRADFELPTGSASSSVHGGAPAAAQAARAAWLRGYLPFMLEGLDKRVGAHELEPNQSQAPRIRLTLPD